MKQPRRFYMDPRPRAELSNNVEFVLASDFDALRLQLSRAKEWMQHKPDCNYTVHGFFNDGTYSGACGCGLTDFLKEVGK